MNGRNFTLPSPAMIVACIALAVALSGASYAAVVLPKNSVGTKQLRNNAVTSSKVAPDTLSGLDIDEATLGPVPAAASAQNAGNAGTLDGLDSAQFLRANAKAVDSDKLDGLDSAQFLRANAKAADSDKLDGLDSGSFMRLSMWNAVYARYKVTVGFNSQGQGCVGNDTCGDTARCDPDDVAVGGGYLGVDNGTHVQNASAVSNAVGDVLSLTGPPRMFHLLWRNNATADEVNIVVWCVDMSPL